MNDVFLDSSVAIGLVFRNAGERAACASALPKDGRLVCSSYVIFEIARGFLRRLITLHNISFEYQTVADVLLAASSGQRRFTYDMPTWTGAVIDYLAELEREDGQSKDQVSLEEFRAKLRGWVRRGWSKLHTTFSIINPIGCREDLPMPFQKSNQLLDQALPDSECGTPSACNLQSFLFSSEAGTQAILSVLEAIPMSKMDNETTKRIAALKHLRSKPLRQEFEGRQCHRCGDALICLEAPQSHLIATKNVKHFQPMADALKKTVLVARSGTSSRIS